VIGTTFSSVNAWERARRSPNPIFIKKIMFLNNRVEKEMELKNHNKTGLENEGKA